MPAIQLARLRTESAYLRTFAENPDLFVKELHIFLDRYANRAQRIGEIGSRPLLPAYHIPRPVLRQIQRELAEFASQFPEKASALIDQLWSQDNYECRLLAARMLGFIRSNDLSGSLDRIEFLFLSNEDEGVAKALLHESLRKLAARSIQLSIERITNWLKSKTVKKQILGVRSLNVLLNIPEFQDMPWLFSVLSPFLRQSHPEVRPFTLELLGHLARQSPQELIHMFKENLQTPIHPDTMWFIRNSQPFFSPEYHPQLRIISRWSSNIAD